MTELLNDLFPPHPALEQPLPADLAGLDAAEVVELSEVWKAGIAWSKSDPLNYGHVPPNWLDAQGLIEEDKVDELVVLGGNRSSKTTFACWMVVQALLKNPGTKIICWSQSEKISNMQQQGAMYQMLPPDMRKKRRHGNAKLLYTLANGFTANSFVLPNGSACFFFFYTQYQQDPNFLEGIEIGWKGEYGEEAPFCNIGNWFDEYLIDPSLMLTIRERLATRDAKSLMTFTPINQYTQTVEEILNEAQTLKTNLADHPDIPEEHKVIPYIQKPRKSSARVIYFYTRENKFNPYERMLRNMEGKEVEYIKMKLYGIPSKVVGSKFPRFSREAHIWEKKDVEEHLFQSENRFTFYQVADPAGSRAWFMIWVAVDPEGRHFVYREWPSLEQFGPWAERSEGKWVYGEAQKHRSCAGLGYETLRDMIEAQEEQTGETLYRRVIDPRMSKAQMPGKKRSTSIIAEMGKLGINFRPAPANLTEDEGIMKIQDLLNYDYNRPIDEANRPHFVISEACGNTIKAFSGYDVPEGMSDLKHPWKDPIDCLRYGAVSNLRFISPNRRASQQPTGGY